MVSNICSVKKLTVDPEKQLASCASGTICYLAVYILCSPINFIETLCHSGVHAETAAWWRPLKKASAATPSTVRLISVRNLKRWGWALFQDALLSIPALHPCASTSGSCRPCTMSSARRTATCRNLFTSRLLCCLFFVVWRVPHGRCTFILFEQWKSTLAMMNQLLSFTPVQFMFWQGWHWSDFGWYLIYLIGAQPTKAIMYNAVLAWTSPYTQKIFAASVSKFCVKILTWLVET